MQTATEILRAALAELIKSSGRGKLSELATRLAKRGVQYGQASLSRFARGEGDIYFEPGMALAELIAEDIGEKLYKDRSVASLGDELKRLKAENELLREELHTQQYLLMKTGKELQALQTNVREAGMEQILRPPESSLDEVAERATDRGKKPPDEGTRGNKKQGGG